MVFLINDDSFKVEWMVRECGTAEGGWVKTEDTVLNWDIFLFPRHSPNRDPNCTVNDLRRRRKSSRD